MNDLDPSNPHEPEVTVVQVPVDSSSPIESGVEDAVPVATEPETAVPVATEPETAVPVATEPETAVPVATEPETAVPVATEPETAVLVATEPETAVPVATEPETAVPVATEPETAVPVATEPETAVPVAIEPETDHPAEEDPYGQEQAAELPDYTGMDLETLLTHLGDSVRKPELSGEHSKVQAIKAQIDHWFQKLKAQQELEIIESEAESPRDPAQTVQQSSLFLLYLDLWHKYQNRRQQEKQEKEARQATNLALKEAMLEELQRLVEEEEQGKTGINEQLRDLQGRWKECGPVPVERRQELWNRYHLLHDKFYNNLRINKELKELDLARNLETKIQLCEQAEQLLLENDVLKAGARLSQLHEQWKSVGPVPRPQSEGIWERFKNASDRIFQSRRGRFEELDQLRAQNLALKTTLCENLETVVRALPDDKPNWSQLTQTIELLQQDWRKTGPVSKDQQEPIWKRFKTGLDQFYAARLQHFKAVKALQQEHLQQREQWCKEAEAWQDSMDWKGGTQALTALQKTWKEGAPLPRKISDKYWNRFRAACDAFFQRKNAHFAEEKSKQAENLQRKQELLQRLTQYTSSGNSQADLAVLMEIQRAWNEIGFVPMGQKEELQNQFRSLTNRWFDQLKLDKEAHREAQYKTRLAQISQNPSGERELSKEQTHLQHKIQELRGEIDLLENNLGFFARSKNADLMRQEVEKKIEVLKSQIIQLEAKLRLVRDSRTQESNLRNNRSNTSKSLG